MAERPYDLSDNTNYPAHLIFAEHSVQRLASLGQAMSVPKNYLLCKVGEIPTACYYIQSGQVLSFEYTDSGEEHIYNINEEGSLILESAVLIRHRMTLSIKTLTPCVLLKIPQTVLLDAITRDPEIALEVLTSVSEKFYSVTEQMRESARHTVQWKVCNLLLTYANRYGVDYDGKLLIQERISQQMMANLLRVNRITIVRAIKDLKNLNLIEQINGYYCIRSRRQLLHHMAYLDAQSGGNG